jgi:hypothetical protein
MPLGDDEREEEIAAALADAGYTGAQVRFYSDAELSPTSHVGAVWYRRWLMIEDDDQHFRNDALRAHANSAKDQQLHRILVPAHPEDRVEFAALLRHELEHARQFDEVGVEVFDLHDFIEKHVLCEAAGDLDGCGGGLINSIPTEIDCNAAASVYITGRFPADEVQRLRSGNRRNLACSRIPPAPHATLVPRMVAFMYVYCAALERCCERAGFTVSAMLTSVHRDAARLWSNLE